MRSFAIPFFLLLAPTGCGVAPQSASDETVSAFEISLPTPEDRSAFLETVRTAARSEGGHLDAATEEELRATGKAMPSAKMTIKAAVWQGADDKENWATIMDLDHVGQVWITFAKGRDEGMARRFRERTMRDIVHRWPNALSLPIIKRRTIPLRRDLIKTPNGYTLNPSAAAKYKS